MFMAVSNKLIDKIGFPASCRSREEYIVPHRKDVKDLLLRHRVKCMKKEQKSKKKYHKTFIFYIVQYIFIATFSLAKGKKSL